MNGTIVAVGHGRCRRRHRRGRLDVARRFPLDARRSRPDASAINGCGPSRTSVTISSPWDPSRSAVTSMPRCGGRAIEDRAGSGSKVPPRGCTERATRPWRSWSRRCRAWWPRGGMRPEAISTPRSGYRRTGPSWRREALPLPGDQRILAATMRDEALIMVGSSTSERGDLDAAIWIRTNGAWTSIDDDALRAPGDQQIEAVDRVGRRRTRRGGLDGRERRDRRRGVDIHRRPGLGPRRGHRHRVGERRGSADVERGIRGNDLHRGRHIAGSREPAPTSPSGSRRTAPSGSARGPPLPMATDPNGSRRS